MSRNYVSDKLSKTIEKKTKQSTSIDKSHKIMPNLKYSFDNRSSSTKNSKAKHINFYEIENSHKKASSRIYRRKNLIPVNKSQFDNSNYDKDLSQPSIYKQNKNTSNRCSPPIHKGYAGGILKEIFDSLQMFDKNVHMLNKVSEKYLYLITLFDRVKSKENITNNHSINSASINEKIEYYDKIWKNFFKLTINNIEKLEKEESQTKKKYNEQIEKFVEYHGLYESEKSKNINQTTKYTEEIQQLKDVLLEKEKYINNYANTLKELNKKLDNKENCDSNEIYLYTQKQLLRDNKLLNSENKQMRETIIHLEKENDALKVKEVKIMKILFSLSRKGIAINDILEKELKTDMKVSNIRSLHETINTESYKDEANSINDSIYSPLCIEPAKNVIKPRQVPLLNLTNINNSVIAFASDDTSKKDEINNTNKMINSNSDHNFSEFKDESISISEKNVSDNNIQYKSKDKHNTSVSNTKTANLTTMEKELLKTFNTINKDKNVISNKSTLSGTENNFNDFKSYSKKNSLLNESMKNAINEIKDSTNISEQDMERLSINSNSWNFRNPINLTNLKDKLQSKKTNISLFNNNFNKNTKIKVKAKTEDFNNKLVQFNTIAVNDDKVMIEQRLNTIENCDVAPERKKSDSKEQKNKKFMN